MRIKFYISFLFSLSVISSFGQDISINGSVWLDDDGNNIFDNDQGINNVKIYLLDAESDEAVDSAFTVNDEFNFPSTDTVILLPGNYYLEIASEEFELGGSLFGFTSCFGHNDANDGVDLDDNGMDAIPTQTTHFALDSVPVNYIDFCFFIECTGENLLASESCSDINETTIICEISTLGQFCNLMSSSVSNGVQPNPICPDGEHTTTFHGLHSWHLMGIIL